MRKAHRIALIGTGFIGSFYLFTLHQQQRSLDRIELVYSRRPERAQEFAKGFHTYLHVLCRSDMLRLHKKTLFWTRPARPDGRRPESAVLRRCCRPVDAEDFGEKDFSLLL